MKQQGWQNYKDRTLELVREGVCDPFDAEGLIGEITTYSDDVGFDYRRARQEMLDEMARLNQNSAVDP